VSLTSRRAFLRATLALLAAGAAGCGPTPGAPAASTPVLSQPTSGPTPPVPATAAPTLVTRQPAGLADTTPAVTPTPVEPTVVITRQPSPSPTSGQAYIAVAYGDSVERITRAAVAALGGIERFVKPGNDVIIKPNICSASYPFEYAATTNPEVVATLVKMCREAGAKRVRVMDSPFSGTDGQAYVISGIEQAVKQAGGDMELMSRMKYQETAIPDGRDIKKWPVYQDVLKADVLINVPIAKTHNLAKLTLGMKNLMGVILDRSQIHYNMGQRLADLLSLMKPSLTVVDAVRILTRGGPTGGNLDWVKKLDTVVASHDVVAADAFAATFFGMKGDDLDYVKAAAAMKLGRKDIENIEIARIQL